MSTGTTNLFEATTDQFFGCGVSLQSKKWATKDWSGENVAGRILMKVRAELSGLDCSSIGDEYPVVSDETTPKSSDLSITGSQLENQATISESHLSKTSDGNASQSSNPGKARNGKDTHWKPRGNRQNRRRNRGRGHGRGSGNPPRISDTNDPNVTSRSVRRQSAYKQLTEKDQNFLSGKNFSGTNDVHVPMEITTSTPKVDKAQDTNLLSDSELAAMGIDPTTEYATDIRRKYSMSEAGV